MDGWHCCSSSCYSMCACNASTVSFCFCWWAYTVCNGIYCDDVLTSTLELYFLSIWTEHVTAFPQNEGKCNLGWSVTFHSSNCSTILHCCLNRNCFSSPGTEDKIESILSDGCFNSFIRRIVILSDKCPVTCGAHLHTWECFHISQWQVVVSISVGVKGRLNRLAFERLLGSKKRELSGWMIHWRQGRSSWGWRDLQVYGPPWD